MDEKTRSNGEAWAAFYVEHHRALTAYALGLMHSIPDAHDLIHDVLVRLMSDHRPPSKPLVLKSLRNRAIDQWRRRPLAAAPQIEPAFLDGEAANELMDREAIESIRSALAELTDAQREVIVLKVYSELTFMQIADITALPIGTVTSHYARGIDKLRGLMNPEIRHA